MIEVVKYKKEHAFHILQRQVREHDFLLSQVGDWEGAAHQWEERGPSFTLLVDGQPEACAGIIIDDPTLGSCWALIPKSDHGYLIYKNILKGMNSLVKKHKFRRLQALVLSGFERGCVLMDRLGFTREGIMQKYGPGGEDLIMYARVF